MITETIFGYTNDGNEIIKYTIKNCKNECVELLNYGASIHGLYILDRFGNLDDIVLGVNQASELNGKSFLGMTVGRVANRIENGRYSIDGKTYQLECNWRGHSLHSGSSNYGTKLFVAEYDGSAQILTFNYLDRGEGGFECEVDVKISYSFNDQSELAIHYDMLTKGDTIIAPTNHVYFNLSGGDVREHRLKINSGYIAKRNEEGIPAGGKISVEDTPADFREMKRIKEAMNHNPEGYFDKAPQRYDEVFILKHSEAVELAAILEDECSGRKLTVWTDMEALILFNAIANPPVTGKLGRMYEGYCGICLETQYVPNAVNCSDFVKPIFKKGMVHNSTTKYCFSII